MTSTPRLSALAIALILLWGLSGCQNPQSESVQTSSELDSSSAGEEHGMGHNHDGHDHAVESDSAPSNMEKMEEGLAELTPEDRQSAMSQHICPVTGEMLGTMGAPEKVEVNGKSVWICCDGCREKLLAEPEKYLSKLQE